MNKCCESLLIRGLMVLILILAHGHGAEAEPRWGSGLAIGELRMAEGEASGLGLLAVDASMPLLPHVDFRGALSSGLNSRATEQGIRVRVEQGYGATLLGHAPLPRGRVYIGYGLTRMEASALSDGERRYVARRGGSMLAGLEWRPNRRMMLVLEYQEALDRDALGLRWLMFGLRYRDI